MEEERENLDHDIVDAAQFLDSLPQMYDAEKLITTILSLDDESQKEIESRVYELERINKEKRTLKDTRNIFADIRFYPEPDDDDPLVHRKSAQEDFAEYKK